MRAIKHLQFSDSLGRILSEEEPLENIVDLVDGKPSKEEKKHLSNVNDWSEYAFENEKEYHAIIYDNDCPLASISNSLYDITIDFIDTYDGKLIKHLTMVYDKYMMDKLFKEDKHIKHLNETMFLSKIISYELSDTMRKSSEILFKENGNANIFITEIDKVTNKSVASAKETKVNISHNWIRTPKSYNDLEYLLDYKTILKSEYLNLNDTA